MTEDSTRYKTADDFRQALEIRIRTQWQKEGGDYQDHTRTVAFERCLARFNPETTTLKGGYALELRLAESRLTKDIDLTINEKALLISDKKEQKEAIRQYVQTCLDKDIGDYFVFEVKHGARSLPNTEGGGTRLTIIAKVADRAFREFHVDIEIQDREILPPERQQGRDVLGFAGIKNPTISIAANELIFAEKLHAYMRTWNDRDNTRVKDIVDMVQLTEQNMDKEKLMHAIDKVFADPDSHEVPEQLSPPPASWEVRYNEMARSVNLSLGLSDAYEKLRKYIQPVLKHCLKGTAEH